MINYFYSDLYQIPEQARAAHRAADPDVKFDELWKVSYSIKLLYG